MASHPDPKNPVITKFYRYAGIGPSAAPQPEEKKTEWKPAAPDPGAEFRDQETAGQRSLKHHWIA